MRQPITLAVRMQNSLSTNWTFLRNSDLRSIEVEAITTDRRQDWLNQSHTDFDTLLPVANRETKLAKIAEDERAVFALYSRGVNTGRDEWVYDFDETRLLAKAQFFCNVYQNELQRYSAEAPNADTISSWVDRSIKWTSELTAHLLRANTLSVVLTRITKGLYRPFTVKYTYYAPMISHRRYQLPNIFPHDQLPDNQAICVCRNGKAFYALATKYLPDYHTTGDSDCLPLYRYTPDGEQVSNITEWGLRHINDHYRQEWGAGFDKRYPDGIGPEDIFAYTYAVLHDPVYRHDYRVDLLREFPRLPLYHDFEHWARMGRELLDLHIGFESADPYPLERVEIDMDERDKRG